MGQARPRAGPFDPSGIGRAFFKVVRAARTSFRLTGGFIVKCNWNFPIHFIDFVLFVPCKNFQTAVIYRQFKELKQQRPFAAFSLPLILSFVLPTIWPLLFLLSTFSKRKRIRLMIGSVFLFHRAPIIALLHKKYFDFLFDSSKSPLVNFFEI